MDPRKWQVIASYRAIHPPILMLITMRCTRRLKLPPRYATSPHPGFFMARFRATPLISPFVRGQQALMIFDRSITPPLLSRGSMQRKGRKGYEFRRENRSIRFFFFFFDADGIFWKFYYFWGWSIIFESDTINVNQSGILEESIRFIIRIELRSPGSRMSNDQIYNRQQAFLVREEIYLIQDRAMYSLGLVSSREDY